MKSAIEVNELSEAGFESGYNDFLRIEGYELPAILQSVIIL